MGKLNSWSSNIVKHFWDSCRTCEGDSMKLKVERLCILQIMVFEYYVMQLKWASLMYHVQDIHTWACGECEHGPLTDEPRDPDGRQLEYFSRYEPGFRALQKITMDQYWLKSLKFYTRFRYAISDI